MATAENVCPLLKKNDETSIDTRKEWYGWMQDL